MNWHEYFFEICDILLKKSKDQSTKIGCVIVNQNHSIVSTGYNDFPRGAIDNGLDSRVANIKQYQVIQLRRERPLKYKWTEHAERNAIYNAAMHGISLINTEIYIKGNPINLPCCCDCTRAIIQSGIIKVHYKNIKDIPDRWKEDNEISTEMFKECKVEVIYHD